MTAVRTTPDPVSDPAGKSGGALGTAIRAEIEALWNNVINPVGTIAGTENAITGVCIPPLIGGYVDCEQFEFTPTVNNTGATTVSFGGGVVDLRAPDGTALVSGDLVGGVAVRCRYHAATGKMRMTNWSQRAINAAAQASISTWWELIGDTTVGTAVAQVEHTFTANRYIAIHQIFSGIGLTGAPSGAKFLVTLRNASGAIVGISSAETLTIAVNLVARAEYTINLVTTGSDKAHYGKFSGIARDIGGGGVLAAVEQMGFDATAPDRVRAAFASGSIAAGRIVTYGLKHP